MKTINQLCSLSNSKTCCCDNLGTMTHIKTPLLGKQVKIQRSIHGNNFKTGEVVTLLDAVIWPPTKKIVYGSENIDGKYCNISDDEFEVISE